jgi:hypothetical protein
MMEVELTKPLPPVTSDGRHRRAWVLVRLHAEPVGTCAIPLDGKPLTPDQFGELLWPALREQVTARFAAAGLPPPATPTGARLAVHPASWPFLRRNSGVGLGGHAGVQPGAPG